MNTMNADLRRARSTLLLISQVYPPDPAAVGQYLGDVCEELARRGWRVVVLTANRGYDDPSVRFPRRETLRGVEVRRLPWSSLGKRAIGLRLVGMLSFLMQAFWRGLAVRHLGAILVSTSPPMASGVALPIAILRRVPFAYWVMDINPDQAVASGRAKSGSLSVRLFDWLNRRVLSRASTAVVLDRFMEARLRAKTGKVNRIRIIPPWPLDQYLSPVNHEDNNFRAAHGMTGRFVVMYSGNHSLVHPLDTILNAARRLRDDDRFRFVFIGGGFAKREIATAVAAEKLGRVLLLPYQSTEMLRYSLSAADLHVISMGDAMVGCVHPCKFYGALAVHRPVLLVGPQECHVTDLFLQENCGWHVAHGDVDRVVKLLTDLVEPAGRALLRSKGGAGGRLLAAGINGPRLRQTWANEVEASWGIQA